MTEAEAQTPQTLTLLTILHVIGSSARPLPTSAGSSAGDVNAGSAEVDAIRNRLLPLKVHVGSPTGMLEFSVAAVELNATAVCADEAPARAPHVMPWIAGVRTSSPSGCQSEAEFEVTTRN